ncbi:MAG: glucokinase [Cyanobacteriota bacterium]
MRTLLAGDIGGTKTILRLAQAADNHAGLPLSPVTIGYEAEFPSQQYPDLVPMVATFLRQAHQVMPNLSPPTQACFGIAGPVVNNACELTNLKWHLSGDRLAHKLNLRTVKLINDFAAIGYGILGLTGDDLHYLQDVEPDPKAAIAVIGAGTGLGQGFLIPQANGHYQVFNSEGGHCDFAPRNREEFDLLTWVQDHQQLPRVSVERIVSGMGLVTLYQYLRSRYPDQESAHLATLYHQWQPQSSQPDPEIDLAAAVAQAASQQTDSLAERALHLFVSAYGAEAGNLALKLLPYGGLYIAGGIAAKILPLLDRYQFLDAFQHKGRMRPLLQQIPIAVIMNPKVGLMGATIHANQL